MIPHENGEKESHLSGQRTNGPASGHLRQPNSRHGGKTLPVDLAFQGSHITNTSHHSNLHLQDIFYYLL